MNRDTTQTFDVIYSIEIYIILMTINQTFVETLLVNQYSNNLLQYNIRFAQTFKK